jgi:DNA mismatch endonuclease (patch repair protein)
MADVFTKDVRSSIMSRIRSKGNASTEMKMIFIFREYGIKGWRRNVNIIGHPDFVFYKQRIAVFVDGCFWHGHNCRLLKPKSNAIYWDQKFSKNRIRDRVVVRKLQELGWITIRFWECELNSSKYRRKILKLKRILVAQ